MHLRVPVSRNSLHLYKASEYKLLRYPQQKVILHPTHKAKGGTSVCLTSGAVEGAVVLWEVQPALEAVGALAADACKVGEGMSGRRR